MAARKTQPPRSRDVCESSSFSTGSEALRGSAPDRRICHTDFEDSSDPSSADLPFAHLAKHLLERLGLPEAIREAVDLVPVSTVLGFFAETASTRALGVLLDELADETFETSYRQGGRSATSYHHCSPTQFGQALHPLRSATSSQVWGASSYQT
jgi:hypothetical protein